MQTKTIKKSIEISTSKEAVWQVLIEDNFTRNWYAEFSEGSHAETDWKKGSKAIFTDNSKCGMVAKVIENKPYELIDLEYEGVVKDGAEDYESEIAKQVKGGHETYRLTEENGTTQLSIACDMAEDYFETMSLAWDKALVKIKSLAESIGEKEPAF
ncbi:MAG: SRPBCC domain-containing protein [Ferruginibacter sp.]|nr:SRPBCC domain-containing protein [Chitinophagaceae bacterium]